jgi:hypothetical protein
MPATIRGAAIVMVAAIALGFGGRGDGSQDGGAEDGTEHRFLDEIGHDVPPRNLAPGPVQITRVAALSVR